MSYLLLGIGLILLIEGLVYALAPSLIDRMFEMLKDMTPPERRFYGVSSALIGAILLWVAKSVW